MEQLLWILILLKCFIDVKMTMIFLSDTQNTATQVISYRNMLHLYSKSALTKLQRHLNPSLEVYAHVIKPRLSCIILTPTWWAIFLQLLGHTFVYTKIWHNPAALKRGWTHLLLKTKTHTSIRAGGHLSEQSNNSWAAAPEKQEKEFVLLKDESKWEKNDNSAAFGRHFTSNPNTTIVIYPSWLSTYVKKSVILYPECIFIGPHCSQCICASTALKLLRENPFQSVSLHMLH